MAKFNIQTFVIKIKNRKYFHVYKFVVISGDTYKQTEGWIWILQNFGSEIWILQTN